MWGKIENDQVTKIYRSPEILKDASGTQYPKTIFKDNTRLADFGIYPVIDKNNRPIHQELYGGVSEGYAWNSTDSQVERTYNYSAKALDDVNEVWSKSEIDANQAPDGTTANDPKLDGNGNQIVTEGLKTILKNKVRDMQSSLLARTDKWIIRKADTDEDVPSTVATYRSGIRSSATTMETAITNASDFDAIIALLTPIYNSDGTIKTPATLYNFPDVPDGMPE